MTLEKKKRNHYRIFTADTYGHFSRRQARKAIRKERSSIRLLIKNRVMSKRERFICNHCKKVLKITDWLWEQCGCIQCPECNTEIMGIGFTDTVLIESPKAKRAFRYGQKER